jgi:hypothetical protein
MIELPATGNDDTSKIALLTYHPSVNLSVQGAWKFGGFYGQFDVNPPFLSEGSSFDCGAAFLPHLEGSEEECCEDRQAGRTKGDERGK